MKNSKLKIILDGTVLAMAAENNLARTGIFFVIKNLCDSLLLRDDINLKIITSVEMKDKMSSFYSNHPYKDCLDLQDVAFGQEKLNFIMPFHPASHDIYKISNSNIFQIIYDFSFHFCPELKDGNIKFEKSILRSLNSKSHALCISKKTRNDLLSISDIEPRKVGVFYPGLRDDLISDREKKIDKKDFSVKKFLKIPEDSKYVLCLSTLEPRKNLETSLKIFENLISKFKLKKLYLVLTGAKGWGKSEEFIKMLPYEIRKKIILTGYVDDKIVYSLYKSCLCFLYPSFYEGFGLPPLESMARGTPVVISDRGSLPEIFGSVTKVFDPYDINGMSSIISYWYENPEKKNLESQKLKNFAKSFSWKKSTKEIIDFINKF